MSERRIPGEPGLWVFVLGDMCVFGLFFAIWSWNHATQPELFDWGHSQVGRGYGLVNTVLLLTSSACAALGLAGARAGNLARARWCYVGTALLGGMFVVVKAFEYAGHIRAGGSELNNDFFMYYFVFTGIHLVHVLIGLIAIVMVIRRCCSPQALSLPFLEGAGVYWHLVDVLWIFLFLLIYLL